MAVSSDAIVKQLLQEIGNQGKLKLRIFPEDNKSDQNPWIQGGLSFGRTDLLYGSCDGVWHREEKWTDPSNNVTVNFKPVVAVEGTLALERGSTGSAQYQRFFHALGAVMNGVIGVYYLRQQKKHIYRGEEISSKMRYDLPMAALNASEIHGIHYLVITDIDDLRRLIVALGEEKFNEADKIIQGIKEKMKNYFYSNAPESYKNLDRYCEGRSIARDSSGNFIKILSTDYRNLTLSEKRGGHILLGEYFIAKYMLKSSLIMFLPRLSKEDIQKLNKSDKKEWKILWHESDGMVLTVDDFDGISEDIKLRIRSLKYAVLKSGSGDKEEWFRIVDELLNGLRDGKISVKKDFKPPTLQRVKVKSLLEF